ncbi:MAG: tetratricopeptide repeat protein [Symploca sp. SIO2C1]|nr:tetratricopeptide repeat protein [Symploca sp. SIO2C1]
MNQKMIDVQVFNLGCFLQDQLLPKQLKKLRQHNLVQLYIEAAVIYCYRWSTWLNPSFAEAHYRLARLFQKQKKWQKAATAFEQATKSGCSKLADAHCNLGRVLFKLERYEESIVALNKAIELAPEEYWYYRILGDVWSEKGGLAEGIKNYQIASQKQIRNTHPHVMLKLPTEQHLSAPNFIIIGQPKCGTSSLYSYLTQHPQILPAIEKEIRFWSFKPNFEKGLDWYLAHFPAIASEQGLITGEATPGYLDSPPAADSLLQEFPHMKLIVVLRNPVDRALSHYYMCTRQSRDKRSLEKAILSGIKDVNNKSYLNLFNNCKISSYLKRSQYIENLSRWMELFSKEQFLIIKSEDLFAEPATIINQVFNFLGVEPYELQVYSNKTKNSYPPISPSMRQTLNDYFRPFNQQLEEYLDRKFDWDC